MCKVHESVASTSKKPLKNIIIIIIIIVIIIANIYQVDLQTSLWLKQHVACIGPHIYPVICNNIKILLEKLRCREWLSQRHPADFFRKFLKQEILFPLTGPLPHHVISARRHIVTIYLPLCVSLRGEQTIALGPNWVFRGSFIGTESFLFPYCL